MSKNHSVDYLVVGAGVSGLAFANAIRSEARASGQKPPTVRVVEKDQEPGGYCKTIVQDGFVWDYSGHFFHFRNPEIETWLTERMPDETIRHVVKRSKIYFGDRDVEFPFQKNIHQLSHDDFIDCLSDLYEADQGTLRGESNANFKSMLYAKYGAGICERFLIPYNEKLYACDLDELDVDAMGRFFPKADLGDVIRNMKTPDNGGYNATFTYAMSGAIAYIHALLCDLPEEVVSLGESLETIDLAARVATTSKGTLTYKRLVSSAPLPKLARMAQVPFKERVFSANKVLVFNLGFDAKGRSDAHWMYYPQRDLRFYRVGYYDNIMDSPRMSLYVEIGLVAGASVDVEAERRRVLADLKKAGVVTDQELVSFHSVVLDPAYVHITQASMSETDRLKASLAKGHVHSVGRYGGWTYCSIEDNIIESRALAKKLSQEPL